MKRRTAGLLRRASTLGLVSALLAACSGDDTFVVVTVTSADVPYAGVQSLLVDLRDCPSTNALTYTRSDHAPIAFSTTQGITFSVSFSSGHTGAVDVGVTAVGANQGSIGYGRVKAFIDPGNTARATVALVTGAPRPANGFAGSCSVPDGGGQIDASVDAGPVLGSACLAGDPTSCGADLTCTTLCVGQTSTSMCTGPGATPPGGVCSANSDCQAGSRCFAADACGVNTCQRQCKTNADCRGGVRCFTETLLCDGTPSGAFICADLCDPVANTGCAAGLACYIFEDETPSCGCPSMAAPRLGADGATCVDSGNCQVGFLCVNETGTGSVCRPLCHLAAPDCGGGRTCVMLTSPNYKTYGACLMALASVLTLPPLVSDARPVGLPDRQVQQYGPRVRPFPTGSQAGRVLRPAAQAAP